MISTDCFYIGGRPTERVVLLSSWTHYCTAFRVDDTEDILSKRVSFIGQVKMLSVSFLFFCRKVKILLSKLNCFKPTIAVIMAVNFGCLTIPLLRIFVLLGGKRCREYFAHPIIHMAAFCLNHQICCQFCTKFAKDPHSARFISSSSHRSSLTNFMARHSVFHARYF
jgi:hypothetical protein